VHLNIVNICYITFNVWVYIVIFPEIENNKS